MDTTGVDPLRHPVEVATAAGTACFTIEGVVVGVDVRAGVAGRLG